MLSLVAALVLLAPELPPECQAPPARDVTPLSGFAQRSGSLSVGLDSVATWCFDSGGTWTGGHKPVKGKLPAALEPTGDCSKAVLSCETAKASIPEELRQLLADTLAELEKPFLGVKYKPKRSGLAERPPEVAQCTSRDRSTLFAQAQARMDLARLASQAQSEYANYRTWLFSEGLLCAQAVARGEKDLTRRGINVDQPVQGGGTQQVPGARAADGGAVVAAGGATSGGATTGGATTGGATTGGTTAGGATTGGTTAGGATAGAATAGGKTSGGTTSGSTTTGGATSGGTTSGGATTGGTTTASATTGGATTGGTTTGGTTTASAATGGATTGGSTTGGTTTGGTTTGGAATGGATAGGAATGGATTGGTTTAGATTGPTTGPDRGGQGALKTIPGLPIPQGAERAMALGRSADAGAPTAAPQLPLGGPTAERERALAGSMLEKWRYFAAERAKLESDGDWREGFLVSRELRDCRCARFAPSDLVHRIETKDRLPALEAEDEKLTRCEVCLQDAYPRWKSRAQKQCALLLELSDFEIGALEGSDDGNGLPPRCVTAARQKRAGIAAPASTTQVTPTGPQGKGAFIIARAPDVVPDAGDFVRPADYAPIPQREDGRLYVRIFTSSACVAELLPGPIQARTGDLLPVPTSAKEITVRGPCGGFAEVYFGREEKPRVSEAFTKTQPLKLQFKK